MRLLCWLILLTASPALAQARVTLEVEPNIAQLGESVQVRVKLSVKGRGGYDRYVPPKFDGFDVRGGGLTSRNIEMINWEITRHEVYLYEAFPKREGKLTIGPAAVHVNGRVIKSRKATVHVRGGQAPPPSAPDQAADPTPTRDERVFIAAQAVPQMAYVGQQVSVKWLLFTQHDILDYRPTQQPTAEHLWAEELQSPRRLDFERQVVGEQVYYRAPLIHKAYFPQQSGELTVGPLKATVWVLRGFGRAEAKLESNPVTLTVKPLPEEGRPVDFAEQNVGQFEMAASLDRDRVKAGDAVTLKLVVRGRGNVRQLRVPTLTTLKGFKVYEPKITDQLQKGNTIAGEKIIEYLLLPSESGPLSIPALQLSYFDPEQQAYRQATTEPLQLTVTGEVPAELPPTVAGTGRQNVLGPDIRPPRQPAPLAHQAPFRLFAPHHLAIVAFPLLLLLLVDLGARVRMWLGKPTARSLSRAVARRVRQQLARARQAEKSDVFYGALTTALQEHLRHRTGLAVEGMTRDELSSQLEEHGFGAQLSQDIVTLLDDLDQGRFAPGADEAAQRDASLQRTESLIGQIGVDKGTLGPVIAGLLLCLLALPARAETIDEAYAAALKNYHAGSYAEAINGFERLLALPLHHPDLFFNLGNAHARQGNLGPAIYNYERASALQPAAEDVRFNLATARRMAATQVQDVVQGAKNARWWQGVLNGLSLRGWFILFAALWWLAFALLFALRYLDAGPTRSGIIAAEGLIAALCLAALVGLAGKTHLENQSQQAIVLPAKVTVREGPGADTRASFDLHAGFKVQVNVTEANWLRVRLPNGLEGWLPRKDVGVL